MTVGTPSPLQTLFQTETCETQPQSRLIGSTAEYSSFHDFQADSGKERSRIVVSVITCTDLKQGIALETGKTSKAYFDACSVIELDEADFTTLDIPKNTNVRVTSAAGTVVLRAVEARQGLSRGLAHIPMGPWANILVPSYTYSTGEPCFCGFDCVVEPAPEEEIVSAVKLMQEMCGLKYTGDRNG